MRRGIEAVEDRLRRKIRDAETGLDERIDYLTRWIMFFVAGMWGGASRTR